MPTVSSSERRKSRATSPGAYLAEAALKRSQAQLQELNAELLHLSRLSEMGRMAAMVAHELNQPLTSISNYTEAATTLIRRGGDFAIPVSLTEAAGDPARGRAIVVNRQVGLCLLCHSGPFPEERLQGSLAPNLGGVGARLSAGQLRLRIVDASRVNPNTIMPPYYRTEGLSRVARAYAGKPILTAEQVEDVIAFLSTLKE